MSKHWKYFKYVVRHKWFVFWAGMSLDVNPIQLLFHDWHKFTPSEWFPYVNFFYGKPRKKPVREKGYYKPTDTGDKAFDMAWLMHQKRGKHHWQWWILPEDEGGVKILPMPDKYRREMLADWLGAGRAQGNGIPVWEWYANHKGKMQLHDETREWIEQELAKLQIEAKKNERKLGEQS